MESEGYTVPSQISARVIEDTVTHCSPGMTEERSVVTLILTMYGYI